MRPNESLHKLFESVKIAVFAIGAVLLTCYAAWAAGITVPSNSRLNINTGTLKVETANGHPGSVTSRGVIKTTTGSIRLNGDWAIYDLGYYDSGAGTVVFSAVAGLQTIHAGALETDTFYNLTHASTGRLGLMMPVVDAELYIRGDFNNLAGVFEANGMPMNVARTWNNTSAAIPLSFVHGGNTVVLNGADQQIFGDTTFYALKKSMSSTTGYTLAFAPGQTQTVEHSLLLRGFGPGHWLTLNNSIAAVPAVANPPAGLVLVPGGSQDIRFVDVWNNDATGGLTLFGRASPDHSDHALYNNTHWEFGAVTVTWTGGYNSHWSNPFNWSLGLVPEAGDTAIIVDGTIYGPVLDADIYLGTLDIRGGAMVTMGGHNATLSVALLNDGAIYLDGNEAVLTAALTDNGVFKYLGTPGGADVDITSNFMVAGMPLAGYHSIIVDDAARSSHGVFNIGADLVIYTDAVFMAGNVALASDKTLTVAADTSIYGGAVDVMAGSLDLNNFTLAGGAFSAPDASHVFTVSGDFTRTAGAFTPNDGTVTLANMAAGSDQTVTGSIAFYGLKKNAAAGSQTLTFGVGTGPGTPYTYMVSDSLTLNGVDSTHLLNIVSSLPGTAPFLSLATGGVQDIFNVSVQDNDASGGLLLVAGGASVGVSNHPHWIFGAATFVWDGTPSPLSLSHTAWDVPSNWDLGLAPRNGDSVQIPGTVDKPHLTAVSGSPVLADLALSAADASLYLDGHGITVTGNFVNDGSIYLQGGEAVDIADPDIYNGTFVYHGDGAGTPFSITGGGRPVMFNNVIVRAPFTGSASTFTADLDLAIYGTLAISGSAFNAAVASLDIGKDFVMTGGSFLAPGAGKTLSVAGDFTNRADAGFDANHGTVVLDGGSLLVPSAQTISGSTTFHALSKTISGGAQVHELIFDHTAVQTITHDLTLQGIAGNELSLKSDLAGDDAGIVLMPGGLQHINYVDVRDSNASGGLWLVARSSTPHGAPMYNNTHWVFGSTLFTWTGALSSDWRMPNNWDLGLVPMNGHGAVEADSVEIPGNVANMPHFTAPRLPPDPEQYPVNLRDMTLDVDARLYADGFDFDVTGAFSNDGTIYLQGDELVNIVDPDIYSGTFEYFGNGVVGSSFPLTSPNIFHDLRIDNNPSGTPSIFVSGVDLLIYGDLTVAGATFDAGDRAIDLRGDVNMTGGNFTAPGSGKSFTVQGGFTHTAGDFAHNNGNVTFDGNNTAVISGDTVFHDFTAQIASGAKTIRFAQGSNQTITGSLDLAGNLAHKLVLRSTTDSTPGNPTSWMLTVLNAAPLANNLDVRDATAVFPNYPVNPATDILAMNSTDNKNGVTPTNIHWLFLTLDLVTPDNGTTAGPTPTIIGHGVPGHVVTVKDGTLAVVATARVDTNGNFRVVLGNDDAAQGTVTKHALDSHPDHPVVNTLTPYYGTFAGNASTFSVVVAPTTDQVPVITSPADMEGLVTGMPEIKGFAHPGSQVLVVAKDEEGRYLLSMPPEAYMAPVVTVAPDGTFAVTLDRPVTRGNNYVSVIVDGVSSAVMTYTVSGVEGVVFDSVSNQPLGGAAVSILKADGTMAVPGVDIEASQGNPGTSGADGAFSFWTANGSFMLRVASAGYTYPTTLTDDKLPAGRAIAAGSRGDVFVMNGHRLTMDQPMDGTPYLFRIEKKANKSEARVGEVVTYTVTVECLSPENPVVAPRLVDVIPPGFKFMSGRALLDGVPMPDPAGNRPLTFLPGDFLPGQKKVVRYQLVIGAGVAPGSYDNVANMQYPSGLVISNRSVAAVKIVLDPLFDAGTVFGKVFYDLNENGRQDDPQYSYEDRQEIVEGPVPNARLAMEDGTVVTADENGKFHVPALVPGRHLLRLDERSLPPGSYLTTEKVQVVDVTPGSIAKVNFGVNMDNIQVVGKDAEYFQKELIVEQNTVPPRPRLNVNMFNDSILLHNDTVIEQIEFRLFTNYVPFLVSWQLDIIDADTKKLVRSFKGSRLNINDPVFWDGRDASGRYLFADRHYAYVLKVRGEHEKWDETKERPLALKVMTDAEMSDRQRQRTVQEKKEEAAARARKYHDFLLALTEGDALKTRNIWVKGDTLTLRPAGHDVRQVVILRNGEVFAELPAAEQRGVTAQDLVEGRSGEEPVPMEVILPDGDYEIEVITAHEKDPAGGPVAMAGVAAHEHPRVLVAGLPMSTGAASARTERYRKPLKVGEDYLMFVAMGDGKVGYNMDRGHIEPVQNNDQYRRGFYEQGKIAYYLKGKIRGKYIVTSSFDTERQVKAALRTFKDNEYYPVYGDHSTVNYDATNTEGPLYLAVDWDRSQAIWGNYAVAFNDTEFANYTRSLYGGKLDYKSVATTDHGEPKTGIAIFHAEVHQRAAHNEFLATGGSLYYFKHNDIVQGTDKVKVEVRDAVTGLVKSALEMKSGVDYSIDLSNGRVLFWQPLSMSVDNNRLISNNLLGGDPIYVVADYEYFVHDQLAEGTRGARVTGALGRNVVAGATYVSETQATGKYQLSGEDVTVHLGKDSTVRAEYAETTAAAQDNFISTDGGITFSDVSGAATSAGKAYGITQDARLFDRVGVKSYYKWVGDGFSTGGTVSQQGKEMSGLAMTFDMTPVTRLTASRDVQRLIAGGNLQTAMQVGGQETITTMVQLVHDARRLRLTEAFSSVQTKGDGTSATERTNTATAAAEAQYALNDKTDIRLKQQVEISGDGKSATTVGIDRQLTRKLKGTLEETVGSDGTATKAGIAANITPRLAVSTDLTLARARTGELSQTVALGSRGQINDKTSLDAAAAVTGGAGGGPRSTVSFGGTTKVNETTSLQALTSVSETAAGAQEGAVTLSGATRIDDTDIKVGVETSQSPEASKSRQALNLEGTRRDAAGRETTGGVRIDDRPVEGKMTVITAGEKGPMTPDVQVAAERSFSIGTTTQEQNNTYKITRIKDGRNLETSYARKFADSQAGVSDSNIFGLTGDVNDKVSVLASLEKGKIRNLDGTLTDRVVFSAGAGYVDKDKETGKVLLQSSTKAEVRLDKGPVDTQQYVFYQAVDGDLDEQTTVRGKFNYSVTRDMDTGKAQAGYKEIMLGAAYRPVAMDRVNLFSEYTYKENKGPTDQVTATDIEQTRMHVLTVGAGYELNDKWELIEKLAMRIMDEKVTGFDFAKTHTWLSVSRVNYTVDQDWKIGAEYRTLAVQEAKDRKSGFLLEAVRGINDNVEMGLGYNFTNFVDDLTNLSYTIQGPYLRMTGKWYDRSPAERARARARWIDRRVELYAWKMVKVEFQRKDSPIAIELNQAYQKAQAANKRGHYAEAQQMYKRIITVTQMMYEEAAQFVRHHIDFEERVYNAFQRAQEYFDKGDIWQARKLWEKIVEDASRAVLE